MRSRIFNLNWEDFNFRDPEQRRQLAGALQYFCALPNKFVPERFAKVQEFMKSHEELIKAQIQAFTLPSDFPEKPSQIVQKYQLATDYDTGYEQIFDVADYTGTSESGFDVMGIGSGLTFREVKRGEKLKVYEMAGGKERCYFAYYGGALGWFRGLFDDKQYWAVENNALEFRNKAYSHRAAVFYQLVEAVSDYKGCCAVVPSDCSDCTADARSIAESINFAAQSILNERQGSRLWTEPADNATHRPHAPWNARPGPDGSGCR